MSMFERPDPWIELRTFRLTKDRKFVAWGIVLPTGQVLVADSPVSSFGNVERMLMLSHAGATFQWSPDIDPTLNLEHELS